MICPPDINTSEFRFTVNKEGAIVYGLGAIKGVGESALENCILSRNQHGAFKSLFDFCLRVDSRKVNRRVLESLIRAGAMDSFGQNRATLLATIDVALHNSEQKQRDSELGQHDLFCTNELKTEHIDVSYVQVDNWNEKTRLLGEKETLGLYLTGHPIDQFESELAQLITSKIVDLKPCRDQTVVVAGLSVAVRTLYTKNGNRMAFLTLDDRTARIELVIFSDLFAECKDILDKDQVLIVEGEVSMDDYTEGYRIACRKILTLEQYRDLRAKRLNLLLTKEQFKDRFLDELRFILQSSRGACGVKVIYRTDDINSELVFSNEWSVKLSQNMLEQLTQLCGKQAVEIEY
jgi:DNA polymerase-3 subunit alpha